MKNQMGHSTYRIDEPRRCKICGHTFNPEYTNGADRMDVPMSRLLEHFEEHGQLVPD